MLVSCALAHREVLSEPAPRALFRKMGDPHLDFELICFVEDVEAQGRVTSDLNFALFQALHHQEMIPPSARRRLPK